MEYLGLVGKGIAALAIGVITNMVEVKLIHKTKWSVIEGEAQNRHIVRIENPMAKPHTLPFCN